MILYYIFILVLQKRYNNQQNNLLLYQNIQIFHHQKSVPNLFPEEQLIIMAKQVQNLYAQRILFQNCYEIQQQKDKVFDQNLSLSAKKNQNNQNITFLSSHTNQYQKFKKNINQQLLNIQKEYSKQFYFNKVNELHIKNFSKNMLFKNYKNLEQNNIKICDKISNKTIYQIKDLSQHGQIVEIIVKFSYFQFLVKILNFQQNCQTFSQPAFQIGKGAYGYINSYVFNKKKYAIKKIKIKQISKQTAQIYYNIRNPIFQYCVYKLLSAVKLGLKLSNQVFGFDLICFQDVACFNMELGMSVPEAICNKLILGDLIYPHLFQNLFFLHDLHIVHFDIKPQNILYSKQHNRLSLIDFGISEIVQQKQGQLSLSNFKGTYQYCYNSFKRLLLKEELQLVDVYWNDVFALNISIQIIQKNTRLNLMSYQYYQDSFNNSKNQYFESYVDEKAVSKLRNYYLEAKLIYLILSEAQAEISDFLLENKVNIVCVLPILLEIYPTMITFRIFKLFLEPACQNLESTNQLKHQILNIYQSSSFKTVLKYDIYKDLFFHKKFKQSQFEIKDATELKTRAILQENLSQTNDQNIFLSYFYFLQWLGKIDFFAINQKIISQEKILQMVRLFGKKLFGNSKSDAQEVGSLLTNCLQKIYFESTQKNKQFFSNDSQIDNPQSLQYLQINKNSIDFQINVLILFKLGAIYYRLGYFFSCKESFSYYLNFTCRPLDFFYTFFEIIKLTYLNGNMNILQIYTQFSYIIGKQVEWEFLEKYKLFYLIKKNKETDYCLNFSDKIAFLWRKASQKQKNLFQYYLETIKILLIPRRVQFSELNNLQQKSLQDMAQQVKILLKKLQNNEIYLPNFYRQKLIIDIYYHFNDCDLFRDLDETIHIYYMLLEKKYQRFIYDIQIQKLYILIANTLQNMHLQDQAIKIFENVKQYNIFGLKINDSDTCLYYKALKLQRKQENNQQASFIKSKLLQKIINQGYQRLKIFDKDLFTVHRLIKYYSSLRSFQLKYKYYFQVKNFLAIFELDEKKFIKILLNIFMFIYSKQFIISEQQQNQVQSEYNFLMNKIQKIFQQNQIPNAYWRAKANHMNKFYGNYQKLEVYREAYKFFGKNDENYFNVIFYIFALRIERLKAIQESCQQDHNYVSPKQNMYNNEILKIYKDLQQNGKFHFAISPHYLPFHRIILEIFMKTKQYSFVTNNLVKITSFIKKLTSIHNSEIINMYKNLVKGFLSDSSFGQTSFKQLLKNASQLFLNSPSQQIAKKYPQILYYYAYLLTLNRNSSMNEKQYRVLLKVMNLLKFVYRKTRIQIKSFFEYMMTEVSQQWIITKRLGFNVKAKRKFFLIKCLRSPEHSNRQKKIFWKQMKKLTQLKNITKEKGAYFEQKFIQKMLKMRYSQQ